MEQKRKILFVVWALEVGGAEQVIVNIINNLNQNAFIPLLCCLTKRGNLPLDKNVKVFVLNKKPGIDLSIIWKMKTIIQDENIALINCHLWTANVWGRIAAFLARIPVIVTEHSVDTWKPLSYLLLDRILSFFMKKMIAVSEEVKIFYVDTVGVAETKIKVISNGVELRPFAIDHDKKELLGTLGIENKSPVLGVIGRLIEDKGHIYLFKSFIQIKEKFPNAVLLVIGDGDDRTQLEQAVKLMEIGNSVLFLGTRMDLDILFGIIDVVVLPSLREGMSITILEALAAEKPVVATDVGSNKTLLCKNEYGKIVPPRNIEKLTEAIYTELDNDASDNLKLEKRKYIENNYSAQRMVKETEQLFADILLT